MRGFSVIIPTLNRTTFVLDTLRDLVHQEFEHPFEIIVVDQSEQRDQEITAFAKAYSIINYQFVTHFKGLPEARNYGVSISKYAYILFLDDDISCGTDLLRHHYKTLDTKKVGVVAGGITEQFKKNVNCKIGAFVSYTASPLRGFHKPAQKDVDHAGGGNFSIKKSLFIEIGGVDEHLTKGAALYEETDLCLRIKKAGYRIVYNHQAHVFHLAAATGGCRVPDLNKYIFSLSRNRSIIIKRYLPWYFRLTAHVYLCKLILAYVYNYRDITLFTSYKKGKSEGGKVALKDILNSSS